MLTAARFVILQHDHPTLHWDFMLDVGATLRTWRLPTIPANGDMLAEQIADHRLAYLDYEGPVSGGRGAVQRFDRGTYRVEASSDNSLDIVIMGETIRGRVHISRDNAATWRLTWTLDSPTSPASPAPAPS